ncbi:3-methyl-2-oxobutanoate hydroxymethyltransferase [Thermodesulfatator autotrophicus]|uniref:3-methyl-2-oxobutanoate hydroxymethyltransferase n=1 Tax=Thermodesulfatator autotrophicus TaxID=1795632 RepID=A0A177EB77_9BACT|nr:3-methyl-2-oxobutanoate hydroxymethyltransferase [Thermodesulfatator autotrophicus]OAG28259.1 3-methyl-2-oxobutanoate hydroxymethyltransferase [Thermodesulfatator autotrophicus]
MANSSKITIPDLLSKKGQEKICALTAYDVLWARLLDEAGIDLILVGDSAAMIVLGYEDTLPITMEEMLVFAKAVSRGAKRALVVGDMPFLSYQTSQEEAIRNAGRFLKEGGCQAVKIEGGEEMAETVAAVVRAGIPVMGHIGLTPQRAHALGGFKVQGKDLESAQKLIRDARALEEAGVFSLVLECVPKELAAYITRELSVPTIGIGAGPDCDGQILVLPDLLGLFEAFRPKFVKSYANFAEEGRKALKAYLQEVKEGIFPGPKESFSLSEEVKKLLKLGE